MASVRSVKMSRFFFRYVFFLAVRTMLRTVKAFRLATALGEATQLADKVVAMNKLSSVLGNGAGKGSQNVLHCAAGALQCVF